MLKEILQNKKRLVLLLFLIVLLALIRLFEDALFYDPFLEYFKNDFIHKALPKLSIVKLFFSYGIRYYLNSIISLGILYLLFKKDVVPFSILLYIILGTILFITFFFTYKAFGENHKMLLFNIRKFIIQPLFLLLFIPAFYYQKKNK